MSVRCGSGQSTGPRGATSVRALVGAAIASIVLVLGMGSIASGHDDIESSIPEHQAQLDDPISSATINFGESVSGVEMGLVDPDNNELPGTVVVLSDTEARLDFDPVEQEGEYIVRYLAEENGHLVSGAITFVYGSQAGTGASAVTWLLFGVAAAAVLGVGAYFSFGRKRSDGGDEDDAAAAVAGHRS